MYREQYREYAKWCKGVMGLNGIWWIDFWAFRSNHCGSETINNGNSTEWSPIWSVIIPVINKIGWPQSRSPICQSWIWLQTELDDTKSCYQLLYLLVYKSNSCISQPPFSRSKIGFFIISSQKGKIQTNRNFPKR